MVQADEKEIRVLIFLFSSLKATCMTNQWGSYCSALYFTAIRKDCFVLQELFSVEERTINVFLCVRELKDRPTQHQRT